MELFRLAMVFAFLAAPLPALALPYSSPTPSPIASASPDASPIAVLDSKLLSQGDAAFKQRKDEPKAREALEDYRKLYALSPGHPEAGWRLAMATYFYGNRFAKDDKEREKLFQEGQEAGKLAAKNDPKCAACQFWTAINMALYGQTVGVFKMVFTLNEIQDRLKISSALDPKYAGAGAYRLLGTIQWKLPGVLGGSDSRARKLFEQAIETDPNEPLNYLFLARLLRDAFDKKDEAAHVAKKGLEVDPAKLERVESFEALKDLQKEFAGKAS